ncbi:MAG: hypothetical protein DUD34_09460 [Lactobacillus sp.]|jgi:hypothetical protein|uniref:Uncharacterized protein n=1 Tax=Lentilactobacillus diolivorans TaxID=179838 RepID=A0ABQ0XC52_9LACO|nr:MAG: hypothetical protein DUD34_09460 [Lactobacillus sp.]GEP23678.1 hypothetical protein LDI01_12710 [Lentilactobacillus diolivorans]
MFINGFLNRLAGLFKGHKFTCHYTGDGAKLQFELNFKNDYFVIGQLVALFTRLRFLPTVT